MIALPIIPKTVQEELEGAKRYFDLHDRCVFCDIVRQERRDGKRIVHEDEDVIVLAPYASRFPFECGYCPTARLASGVLPSRDLSQPRFDARQIIVQIDRALEVAPPITLSFTTAQ